MEAALPPKSRDQSADGVARRWASINDTAAYLSVHPRTIRQLVHDGVLTQYALGPRLKRLDLNEVDRVLTRGGALIPGDGRLT